ncbi:MAG: four helix bundle protein, partial [Paludibacter sp.]
MIESLIIANNFEALDVWKEYYIFRKQISNVVKIFPNEEKYRLSNQLIRASRSVIANIADGHGHYHFQGNSLFCSDR